MNKIKKFCEKYNDEIIVVGIGFGIGLAIIVGLQAKEIKGLNVIWRHNDRVFDGLVAENRLLKSIITKIVKV